MTDETPLDATFAHMERSEADRLQFFATLADAELYVLLEQEADGQTITPQLFNVDGRDIILAFDTDARLAAFADGPAAYAALPGRVIAELLCAEDLALGLNLDVAPSSTVLEPDALAWLIERLGQEGPRAHDAHIEQVSRPGNVPDILLEALGARLAASVGLATSAVLVEADYATQTKAHLLIVLGAAERAEPALARAVNEALTFSGIDAASLDVVFVPEDHALAVRALKVGLRFDIPAPPEPTQQVPPPPGSDPDKPPKLR